MGSPRTLPQVLVPRYLRLPVRGRIGADGAELTPLSTEDVDAAAKVFADEGVESVAVCLFNSFLDGVHERTVGSQLARSWTGKWVSLSSEVMPTMGEYERGSTAVVNAYVAPKVTSYLRALDEQLRQFGLPRSLLLLQSNGGAVSVDQVAARPVMLVLSGPAAGVGALKGCAVRSTGRPPGVRSSLPDARRSESRSCSKSRRWRLNFQSKVFAGSAFTHSARSSLVCW